MSIPEQGRARSRWPSLEPRWTTHPQRGARQAWLQLLRQHTSLRESYQRIGAQLVLPRDSCLAELPAGAVPIVQRGELRGKWRRLVPIARPLAPRLQGRTRRPGIDPPIPADADEDWT